MVQVVRIPWTPFLAFVGTAIWVVGMHMLWAGNLGPRGIVTSAAAGAVVMVAAGVVGWLADRRQTGGKP